mmetsp:Transcript_23079/g.39263  ORF Transcript_23079/g.39263 Transcript_23079/m.39263 type:complete len:374 (+) Transcript_23079:2605-3726(+)
MNRRQDRGTKGRRARLADARAWFMSVHFPLRTARVAEAAGQASVAAHIAQLRDAMHRRTHKDDQQRRHGQHHSGKRHLGWQLVCRLFGPHHAFVAHLARIDPQSVRDGGTKAGRLHQNGHERGHILHAAAFGHVVQYGDLVLARLHLVADDLELFGQRRERGLQFVGHSGDGLVQRLARFHTDQHHIEAVGEALGDLFLAFLNPAGDPVLWQVVANTARTNGIHDDLLRGHAVGSDNKVYIDHTAHKAQEAQHKLRRMENAHRIARLVSRLAQGQLPLAQFGDVLGFEKVRELVELFVMGALAQGFLARPRDGCACLDVPLELGQRIFGLSDHHDRDDGNHHHAQNAHDNDGSKGPKRVGDRCQKLHDGLLRL